MVAVYDTLARAVLPLEAADGRALTMYSCGPTVYRYAHIGNLRTFLMADIVRRALEYSGVDVHQVMNITDVGHMTDELSDRGEDKMLLAAGLENKSPEDIAAHYTGAFLSDMAAINIAPARSYPRASAYIRQMVELIVRLIERGHAYENEGTVYYDVRSFPDYGKLSGNTLDKLIAGHRKDIDDPRKRHHADFVLWMAAGPQRLIRFPSPWGEGYPGWHIECSAMSMDAFGEQFDLHTGGEDNVFPHHEDEIAQSEGAVGHRVVRRWLHGAHLLSEGRKMAKSAGNFYDLRDLAARGHADPLAVRLLFLQSRYRAQMNFTLDALSGAERTLTRWRRIAAESAAHPPAEADTGAYEKRFTDALSDDLDTPSAIALVAEVISTSSLPPAARAALLAKWDTVLALDLARDTHVRVEIPTDVQDLVEQRERARAAKDYAAADALRAQVTARGYDVEDTPEGPRVRAR